MPICHQKQFIFFHIPRCGGTSIEKYFGLYNRQSLYGVLNTGSTVITLQHLTPMDLLNSGLVNHDTFQAYFKFTVIRDPFDRLASDYFWQQRYDTHNEFSGSSFDQYLKTAERVMEEGLYFEKQHYDHFRPMTMYCAKEGNLLVDDILLLENIDMELKRIKNVIGEVELMRVNRSRETYEHLRTRSNYHKVYKLYAADKALYDSITDLK